MAGTERPRVLHILPPLAGGRSVPPTTAQLVIESLRNEYRNEIVLGAAEDEEPPSLPGNAQAVRSFPPLRGAPLPGRLHQIARAMAPYDLVLSHGYGAMDAGLALTVFSGAYRLPPLVHHEWAPAEGSGWRARWYRQVALGRAAGLVVTDEAGERTALEEWQQPLGRVKLLPRMVDTRAYAGPVAADALPAVVKQRGERWLGTIIDRDAKASALVETLRALPDEWHLVALSAAGGSAGAALRAAADAAKLAARVHLPGEGARFAPAFALFDALYLAPGSTVQAEAVLAGAAAGIPVVIERDEPAAALLAAENRELLAGGDGSAALARLAAEPALLRAVGEANRAAAAAHDLRAVLPAYQRLYRSAIAQGHTAGRG